MQIELKGNLVGLKHLGIEPGMQFEAETIEGKEYELYFYYHRNFCVVGPDNYNILKSKKYN